MVWVHSDIELVLCCRPPEFATHQNIGFPGHVSDKSLRGVVRVKQASGILALGGCKQVSDESPSDIFELVLFVAGRPNSQHI